MYVKYVFKALKLLLQPEELEFFHMLSPWKLDLKKNKKEKIAQFGALAKNMHGCFVACKC